MAEYEESGEYEIEAEAARLRLELRLSEGYTPEAVAQALAVDVSTVYRWLQLGKLGGKQIGKQWRITAEQVKDFIERQDLERKVLRDAKEELRKIRRLRPEKKWKIEGCEICRRPIVTDGVHDIEGRIVAWLFSDGKPFFSCSDDCDEEIGARLQPAGRSAEDLPFE